MESPMLILILVAFAVAFPIVALVAFRRARLRRFSRQFPDALKLMSRATRDGHGFESAIDVVASEMLPPVSTEFRRLIATRQQGRPLEDALDELARGVPCDDVQLFSAAVSIQQRCQGNLTLVLERVQTVVRERSLLRGEAYARTSELRLSASVLLALPGVSCLAVWFVAPGYLDPLFAHPLGRQLSAAAVGLMTLGAVSLRGIIRIED